MYSTADDGTRIYWKTKGEGPPLLLIAGTGCDHGWWACQLEALSRDHTLILADMRGAGRSDVPVDRGSYDSRRMAADAARVIEDAGLGPAHVAGHSLGSCIAQELALSRAELVRSVQLHATWAHADEWLRRAFVGTMAYATGLGDRQMAWKTVGMWIFSPEYLNTWEPQEVAEAVSAEFIENEHLDAGDGLLGHLHADGLHDTRDTIGAIEAPVLVTAGELDVCIPPRYGKVVQEAIPGARWHLFEGARSAHAYPLEMASSFNEVCREFLAAV